MRRESGKTGDGLGKSLISGIEKVSPKLAGSLTDMLGVAGRMGGPALAVGIAAATPLIGATVSAAVIGGAGLGGVLGGVMLAARDPRVAAAGQQLGKNLLGSLEKAAQASFVEPTLRNIGKIENRFAQMETRINRIFGNSAAFLDPLVDGALDAIDGILRGLDALTANGGSTMEALGKVIGGVGQALGNAFEMIASGGDNAAAALKFIGFILISSIEAFGVAVRGLTALFGVMVDLAKPTIGLAGAFGLLDEKTEGAANSALAAAPATTQLQAGIAGVGTAAVTAAQPVATFSDKVNNLASIGRNAFDATTNLAAALDTAKTALRENGKTLDEHSAKGRANRSALSAVAAQMVASYNATVQLNGEGRVANQVAGQNRAAFIRLATQFGVSRQRAAEMATQFGLIPSKKSTDFHVNTHDAAARAAALNQKLNNAARNRTAHVNVVINAGRLASIENRLNRLGGSLYNAAGVSWAAGGTNSGMARTGGPTPVSVTSNVAVSLDGAPFRAYTARQIRASAERAAWRQRVGPR